MARVTHENRAPQQVVEGTTAVAGKGNAESSKSLWWRQHVAAFLANLSALAAGVAIGWSAPAQAVLRGEAEGSALRMSLEERSWASALLPLGALVGCWPAGLLGARVGRKRALLIFTTPAAVGWALIAAADDEVWMLFLGRLLTGIAAGAAAVLVALYCEEIAAVATRGKIGSYLDVFLTVGMLWAYALGAWLPYFWFCASALLPVVAFALSFCWMPESPLFLAACGRDQDAQKALQWLRGPRADVRAELQIICDSIEKSESRGCSMPKVDRHTAKAVGIVLGIMFFTQATGVNAFIYYTTDIFTEAGTSMSADTATAVTGVVNVVGTLFPTLLVDRLGRRPLLAGTEAAMGCCVTALAAYTFLQEKGAALDGWRWLPLAALLLYFFLISAGPGPLSWFMMAELLPPAARGWGSAVAVGFSRALALLITKEFPPAAAALGRASTYAAFAVACFAGAAFVLLCVPETRGRTRQQIQEALAGKKEMRDGPGAA